MPASSPRSRTPPTRTCGCASDARVRGPRYSWRVKLYVAPLSGNSYKARLFLLMLGLEHESIDVDWRTGANRTEWFRAISPRMKVPALVDGEVTVWDSQAILAYLARTYAPEWMPTEPPALAQVMQWLAVSENELLAGLMNARSMLRYGVTGDLEEAQATARVGLDALEGQLREHEWLACERPTVADVACFGYVNIMEEGGIAPVEYPAIQSWVARMEALPGFVAMYDCV